MAINRFALVPTKLNPSYAQYIRSVRRWDIPPEAQVELKANGQPGYTLVGTAGRVMTREGWGLKADGSTGYYWRSITSETSRPAWIMCRFKAGGVGTEQREIYSLGSSSAALGAYLGIASGNSTASSAITAHFRGFSNNSPVMSVQGPLPVTGEFYTVVAVFPSSVGSEARMYVNGVEYAGAGTSTLTSELVYETVGALKRGNISLFSDDTVLLTAQGFDVLPGGMARELSLDANLLFATGSNPVFAAPYPPTVIGLTAPTLGLTPQDIAQTRTQNLTAAALTLTPNSVTALWTIRPATADFAFNREVFQITSTNTLGVSTCDFTALEISAQSVASLDTAAMDFVANDVQLAITNNLDVGNLNLAGQETQQVASTTLGTATMDFVGKNITEIQVVALDATALNFTAQTSNPVAVVTLSTAAMNMVVLDITASNAPTGYVLGLATRAMDFAVNPISNTASTTLSAAAMNDVAYELHLVSSNVLTAPTFDLAPQPLTVTQAAVVVALVPATFDFVPGAIQAAGTSSVGDRRRIMMGVGK